MYFCAFFLRAAELQEGISREPPLQLAPLGLLGPFIKNESVAILENAGEGEATMALISPPLEELTYTLLLPAVLYMPEISSAVMAV